MADFSRFPVSLLSTVCHDFVDSTVVESLFSSSGMPVPSGASVLVKPNLVSPDAFIAVTNPFLVTAVCAFLQDHGNRVICGDSPAFGSPSKVAARSGLDVMLGKIGVRVDELDRPVPVTLPCGIRTAISQKVLEAEFIVNLPKLKAHCQMGITAGVKNMFGTVCGFRKALAHFRHGDVKNAFPSLILELAEMLAPACNILDAVTAMHITGPVNGAPFRLNLLAASASPFALDTAVYDLLGISPHDRRISLWREARKRNMPAAFRKNIAYPVALPEDFDATGFLLPEVLKPETFNPFKLLRGRLRSFLMRFPF